MIGPPMAHEMPQLPGVTHRFVNVGDIRMHVALAGEGDPVVLLHGWPQHWYAWRGVIPSLAERYRVIAADLRGFGWTDIAWTGFEKESMADDILRLLDGLELERVRLAGHDWGGWIGFLLALRRPERIERLVAMSTPPPWLRLTPRSALAARSLSYQLVLAAPLLGQRLIEQNPAFIRRRLRKWTSVSDALTKEDYRIYARDLKAPTRARASMLLYRTFLLRELVPVLRGRYRDARLEPPALLLHGRKDPVISPRLLWGAERGARDLRVELVPRAGHFLPEERADAVSERLHEFFGQAVAEPLAPAPPG